MGDEGRGMIRVFMNGQLFMYRGGMYVCEGG